MFCPECGKEVSDTAKFCASCGNQISKQETVSEPEPVVDPEIAKSGLKWPKETLEKIDELKKLKNSKPVEPPKQKEKSTQEPNWREKGITSNPVPEPVVEPEPVQEPEPVVKSEPAVESKFQEDEMTFLEKFITKAKPIDWLTLKEESSYPVPIPNLLKYFTYSIAFILAIRQIAEVVAYPYYYVLSVIAGPDFAYYFFVETMWYYIAFIGILPIIIYRTLTVNKPKNWKKHFCFVTFCLISFPLQLLNPLAYIFTLSSDSLFVIWLFFIPGWYWYFYRKSNVAEYFDQFED